MKKEQKSEKDNSKTVVKILIVTNDHLITGKLHLPMPSVVDNPVHDNLLFYALNCGNKFIQLRDCLISKKDVIEYQPECVDCYNINLDIVHSCQIIDED